MRDVRLSLYLFWFTIVASQTPAASHTVHASGVVISSLGHTHWGHTWAQRGRAGQLDERDVVVDGVAVIVGVPENLREGTCWSWRSKQEAGDKGPSEATDLADPHLLDALLV